MKNIQNLENIMGILFYFLFILFYFILFIYLFFLIYFAFSFFKRPKFFFLFKAASSPGKEFAGPIPLLGSQTIGIPNYCGRSFVCSTVRTCEASGGNLALRPALLGTRFSLEIFLISNFRETCYSFANIPNS